MRQPLLLINHLSYTIPNTTIAFEKLSFAFDCRRYGIIGDNGIGKTTLLKLMAGLLRPEQGTIQYQGRLLYCPQDYNPLSPEESIAETLGIAEKYHALMRLAHGNFRENDDEIIAD